MRRKNANKEEEVEEDDKRQREKVKQSADCVQERRNNGDSR